MDSDQPAASSASLSASSDAMLLMYNDFSAQTTNNFGINTMTYNAGPQRLNHGQLSQPPSTDQWPIDPNPGTVRPNFMDRSVLSVPEKPAAFPSPHASVSRRDVATQTRIVNEALKEAKLKQITSQFDGDPELLKAFLMHCVHSQPKTFNDIASEYNIKQNYAEGKIRDLPAVRFREFGMLSRLLRLFLSDIRHRYRDAAKPG